MICCGFCVNISIGQANFEGYTTEVIFQVFQMTFDDRQCFSTKRGFGELHVVHFMRHVLVKCHKKYKAYGVLMP